MDRIQKRLVARIRELAKKQRIALSHIPDRAGVSRSHFWDVMRGHKSPTLHWMTEIAEVFDVDVSELLKPRD